MATPVYPVFPAGMEYGQELDAQGNITHVGYYGKGSNFANEVLPAFIVNFNRLIDAATNPLPIDAAKVSSGVFDIARIPALDASKITTGVIDIARMPAAVIERMTAVVNQAARFALTINDVQAGDCVLQLDTSIMYWVIDASNLANESGYHQYNAGTAASVPWSGVTGKPTTLNGYGIADAYTKTASDGKYATLGANSNITSITGLTTALSISQGGTSATTAAAALVALGAAPAGYGCGGLLTTLNNPDLNTLPANSGSFYINGVSANTPYVTSGYLRADMSASSLYAKQDFTSVDGVNTYTRVCNSAGVWQPWQQLATTASPAFTGATTIINMDTTYTGSYGLLIQAGANTASSYTLKLVDYDGLTNFIVNGKGNVGGGGVTNPQASLHFGGNTIFGVIDTGIVNVPDSAIDNSQCYVYMNQAINKLTFRVRNSSGTLQNFTLSPS